MRDEGGDLMPASRNCIHTTFGFVFCVIVLSAFFPYSVPAQNRTVRARIAIGYATLGFPELASAFAGRSDFEIAGDALSAAMGFSLLIPLSQSFGIAVGFEYHRTNAHRFLTSYRNHELYDHWDVRFIPITIGCEWVLPVGEIGGKPYVGIGAGRSVGWVERESNYGYSASGNPPVFEHGDPQPYAAYVKAGLRFQLGPVVGDVAIEYWRTGSLRPTSFSAFNPAITQGMYLSGPALVIAVVL
jgi:hypothetical protein